jgi:DNA (cytosine-5)-methyltransferase 1
MRHGSLFSGIGGFDLAAEWMGWENVFHCEWMEFPRKVLDYHFPNADSHIDICKTDFKKYANTIDILTGGFPCQPFSLAGKRKGTDDERYLWGEMLRAVQEIKPKFVIAENVFGITNIDGGLVFEQVCLDLEAEGYEVQSFIIGAVSKNAPHRRDRCWFIGVRNATDTNGDGLNQCNGNDEINTGQGGEYALGDAQQGNVNGNATDSDLPRCKREKELCQPEGQTGIIGDGWEWTATDTNNNGLKAFNDKESKLGQKSRTKIFSRNSSESIYRRENNWENFPTQSPICGGDDGLPTELDGITFSKWRAESIKGYGNAIVPQVALELFKIIETI